LPAALKACEWLQIVSGVAWVAGATGLVIGGDVLGRPRRRGVGMHTGPVRRVGGDADDSGVRITSDDDGAVLHVAVHGQWDWRLSRTVRTAVNKCLAEHPTAVIVNLRAVDDPRGSSAPLLVMARRVGRARQPRVSIAVCVAAGSQLESRLRATGAAGLLPLYATVSQARAALDRHRTAPDQVQLELRPLPHAAQQARRLVAEAGHRWARPQLVHPAELVMSELTSNAVQHAGTDMLLTVSRRGAGLYLAVRDGSTVLPPLPARADATADTRPDQYGYGLWLVDRIAAAWGARLTHQRTGKVVWAVVRPSLPGRPPGSSPSPPQTPNVAAGTAEPAPLAPPRVKLSAREQEVLRYLPLAAEDIAGRLEVSVNTVKAHLKNIYRKLGVRNRMQAVRQVTSGE